MDWNYMKSFLAIAETGSLEQASQKMRVSSTTVFRHIHALEKETGARLFDRVRGHYQLTEAGADMLQPARQIMNSFDAINHHISGRDISPSGLVRITAPTSFSYFLLPDCFARFRETYPDIQLELLASNQEFNMTQRYADIAIRIASHPPDHLVGREIRTISWAIYGTPDDAATDDLDFLLQQDFIGACGTLRSHPVYQWFEKSHRGEIHQQCDDLIAMAHLARAGNGFACLPTDLAVPGLKRLTLLNDIAPNRLWVLTHPDLRQVERIKLTMRWIANTLKNDPKLSTTERQTA
ncbi:LysR family transcriptional regulator [Thalassospira lucentensis]|nr:LysR family transcriptional regulator [Thalassospira lucentensis]